jgi:hypothetical protein
MPRSRRERAWGSEAWTDPIPCHQRIGGNFAAFPQRVWQTVANARTGEVFLLRTFAGITEVRRFVRCEADDPGHVDGDAGPAGTDDTAAAP